MNWALRGIKSCLAEEGRAFQVGPSLLRGNACPVQTVKMVGRVAGECEAGWIGARWVSQEG